MSHARSILLAGLLVLSVVVTGAGPALAQSTETGPISYSYEGGAETLVIDTSAMDTGTDFTVEYSTMEGPDNPTVLARETYNTANLHGDELWFYNEGAYDTVKVTVSGYSGGEPKFETRGVVTSLNLQKTVVGTTGGDPDTQCDLSDRISNAVGGMTHLDCTKPGIKKVNSTTDASLLKHRIYQSSRNTHAQFENQRVVFDNYLDDSETTALIIGKNAYIKALNDGAGKLEAEQRARDAVENYYAVKQRNLIAQWNSGVAQAQYLNNTLSSSQTGVSMDFHNVNGGVMQHTNGDLTWRIHGTTSKSMQLLNGNTTTVDGINVREWDFGDNHWNPYSQDVYINTGPVTPQSGHTVSAVRAKPTSSTSDGVEYLKFSEFAEQWTQIKTHNSNVQAEIQTLANNTYSAYQQGEISNSDLVDPYMLASQQSPGDDFQGWAAAQLTLMGTNSPENFDQIGSFNVTTGDGTQYKGVLFSQENPASGQFENGTTYNTSNIGGTQYVVTSDRIVELEGEFTIDSISTHDGQTVQNVTIQKTTYETTNVTELKQQYEDLARKQAEIEAREQNLRGSAGGGLLGGSSSSVVLVLIGVGALYAVSQRQTGGNN
ncbi:hypothetical protein DVK00_06600 [Haloarcula sp. Atlit-47R]|uniref:hypothetical protein n=1 Tax=Haloarcula sp. Atlit-47R TaxID=2282132 RepID=UPI000EF17D5A|nr:hypothetical protein [Haloarcula sp. Atlit-47R]RLM48162.1 hypothetical protein DVK00_06600 [Haloarcula sp. Atlit-47R]